jgi:DNA-binding NarL/FixJ family response regulator
LLPAASTEYNRLSFGIKGPVVKKIKVLLALRPRIVCELVGHLVTAADMQVVGTMNPSRTVFRVIEDRDPDVVMIPLGDSQTVPDLCTRILSQHPDLVVVGLSPDTRRACLFSRPIVSERLSPVSTEGFVEAIRAAARASSPGSPFGRRETAPRRPRDDNPPHRTPLQPERAAAQHSSQAARPRPLPAPSCPTLRPASADQVLHMCRKDTRSWRPESLRSRLCAPTRTCPRGASRPPSPMLPRWSVTS